MSGKKYAIVGGGIIGLAIARQMSDQGLAVTLLEKETSWGFHQTGHNSGVVHAGPYYKPKSLKAEMCLAGNRSMVEFAERFSIAHDRCGKLIISSTAAEDERLSALAERAKSNGVDCRLVTKAEAQEFEPHIDPIRALRVENTGIIDYKAVAQKLADLAISEGANLLLGSEVTAIQTLGNKTLITYNDGDTIECDFLINAGGLYSDKIAKLAGVQPSVRIIPFRGEYYELIEEKRGLVKGLIYPVPDPQLPFLGVHLTRMIDGSVHAGPNAVFALAREGYRWRDVSISETLSALTYPGFMKLAMHNIPTGFNEVVRSASKARFAKDLAKLVPAISKSDLVDSGSGVRAQAVNADGTLADDFVIQLAHNQIHILNAPSPAATTSLEIAKYILQIIDKNE